MQNAILNLVNMPLSRAALTTYASVSQAGQRRHNEAHTQPSYPRLVFSNGNIGSTVPLRMSVMAFNKLGVKPLTDSPIHRNRYYT